MNLATVTPTEDHPDNPSLSTPLSSTLLSRAINGRVVFLSGAANGLGLLAARRFAAVGYRVAAVDIDMDKVAAVATAIEASGGVCAPFAADVSSVLQVKDVMKRILKRFGRLDCAFNNAGIVGKAGLGKLRYWSEQEFDAAMGVNVKGMFLCIQEQLEVFRRQGPAPDGFPYAIVNTASVAGMRGSHGMSVYGASKAAVINMTRAVAVEYATVGVRVNAVCPSIVRTRMSGPAEQAEALAKATNPSRRVGTADEVINAVEFLLDPRTTFVTGVALPVDGGLSAKM